LHFAAGCLKSFLLHSFNCCSSLKNAIPYTIPELPHIALSMPHQHTHRHRPKDQHSYTCRGRDKTPSLRAVTHVCCYFSYRTKHEYSCWSWNFTTDTGNNNYTDTPIHTHKQAHTLTSSNLECNFIHADVISYEE